MVSSVIFELLGLPLGLPPPRRFFTLLNMKRLKAALIIVVPLALLFAVAWYVIVRQGTSDRIRTGADQYVQAILNKDYTTAVALTQKHLVELSGGKTAIVAAMTDQLTQFHAQGVGYDTINVGDPEAVLKIGAWSVSLVPAQVVLKAPGGRLKDDSYLLAMSDDDGKTWSYLTLSMSADQFFQVYPELKGKFTFPAKNAPVVEKNQ